MGDRRFDHAYEKVLAARDRTAAIRGLSDTEVVYALAAASRKLDSYLANVLAVEVLNRRRSQRARLWGLIAGLASAVVLRTALIVADSFASRDPLGLPLWLSSVAAIVPAAGIGLGVYLSFRRRPLA